MDGAPDSKRPRRSASLPADKWSVIWKDLPVCLGGCVGVGSEWGVCVRECVCINVFVNVCVCVSVVCMWVCVCVCVCMCVCVCVCV